MLSQSYKKDKKEWWSVYSSPHLRLQSPLQGMLKSYANDKVCSTSFYRRHKTDILLCANTVQKPHPGGDKNVKTLFDLQAKTSLF